MIQYLNIGDTGGELVAKWKNNFDESGGLGYIIQPTDNIGSNLWWNNIISSYHSFFIINDYDFGGATVTIPSDVTLYFNGGVWSNGEIIGDQTNLDVIGFQQAFNIDLTLSGTWLCPGIAIQHYGAVSNADSSTYSNSISAILQKCLDSPLNVVIPAGYYYLDVGVIASIGKSVNNIGNQNSYIYTDNDIDFLTIRCSDFYWLGSALMDGSNILSHSKSYFRYDMNYSVYSGKIEINIRGNRSTLLTGQNTSTSILFDTDNLTSANHEIHNVLITGSSYHTKYGIWVQGVNPLYAVYLSSIYTEQLWIIETKQAFRFEQGERCVIRGWTQDGAVLSDEEREMPIVYNNGNVNVIDVMFYDYDPQEAVLIAPFRHINTIENSGLYCTVFTGESLTVRNGFYTDVIEHVNFRSNALLTGNRGLEHAVLRRGFQKSSFISRLENQLHYIDKYSVVTIKKYDGSEKDFDTELDETVAAETANLTITHSDKFFAGYGSSPYLTWTNEATKLTDYVEIVVNATLFVSRMLVSISQTYTNCQRMQLIITEAITGTVFSYDTYPLRGDFVDYCKFNGNSIIGKNVTKIILRIIGSDTIDENLYINDIVATGETVPISPIVDIGGGQTIYGNLAVNDGVKEVDLPVYADNAAAKVGGLVAGDPYRTATGIRMVVYD